VSLSVAPLDVWSPLAAASWTFGEARPRRYEREHTYTTPRHVQRRREFADGAAPTYRRDR